MGASEIVFSLSQESDGGYVAECLSHDIFTEGETWEDARKHVLAAVNDFFLANPSHEACACTW